MSDLVLITELWERASAKTGATYFSGFLGKSRIVMFKGEMRADNVQTWNLYCTPGKDQSAATTAPPPAVKPATTPPLLDRPFDDEAPNFG